MRHTTVVLAALWLSVPAAAATVIALEAPHEGQTLSAGFEIARRTTATVDAIVALDPDRRSWLERLFSDDRAVDETPFRVHAVVLEADSRRTVWRARADDGRRESADTVRSTAELTLEPGRYEVHLVALARGSRGPGLFLGNDAVDAGRRASRVRLDIRTDDVRRFEPDGRPEGALLRLGPVPSGRVERAGLVLSRDATVRVRAVFEGPSESPADYPWIVEADSGAIVWLPRPSESRPAGGAGKNLLVDGSVALPAGRYEVAYGTDDSHAIDGFNASPPDDPLGWGVAVLPTPGLASTAWSTFEPGSRAPPALGWIRVGDGATLREPFRLAHDGALRIRASGEWTAQSGFVDGASIVDVATGRVVWRMTESNTIGAGGAAKNRRFTGEVRLPAGIYELRYVSDGSHSHDGWNAAVPFEPDAWGVAAWPGGDLGADDVERLADDETAPRAPRGATRRRQGIDCPGDEVRLQRLGPPTRAGDLRSASVAHAVRRRPDPRHAGRPRRRSLGRGVTVAADERGPESDSPTTERQLRRQGEDESFVPVIVKRTDEARRHPDDVLRQAIEEGLEQLCRRPLSLFLSAIGAGLLLGFTAMAVAVVGAVVADAQLAVWIRFATALVYPLGFVVCLMSGFELFTEHTATAVYPVLDRRTGVVRLLRLWLLVGSGNLVGTLASGALLALAEPIVQAREGYVRAATHLVDADLLPLFVSALLGGWLMALGAWLILATPPTVSQLVSIYIVTFLIGLGGLAHSIAGAAEVFSAYFIAGAPSLSAGLRFIAIALVGNLVGGSLFVASLNYGHIRESQRAD